MSAEQLFSFMRTAAVLLWLVGLTLAEFIGASTVGFVLVLTGVACGASAGSFYVIVNQQRKTNQESRP